MSFELTKKESFAENVARLAGERLDGVLSFLSGGAPGESGDTGDYSTHTARKDLKKLRALLRLAHAGLGEETFARENTVFRDAGRALSAVRDAQVLVEAFDALRGETVGRLAPETFETIHRRLQDDVGTVEAASAAPDQIPAAAEALRQARERLADWPRPPRDGWRVPGRGLTAVYRRGRRAMRRAATTPAEEDFHEWRKQVKYLGAQVALLCPLRPKKLARLGKALDRLSDLLGSEHDLSVLHAHLRSRPETWVSPPELELIGSLIDTHRQALQQQALGLGQVVYKAKPARVRRRFRRYWKAWRAAG